MSKRSGKRFPGSGGAVLLAAMLAGCGGGDMESAAGAAEPALPYAVEYPDVGYGTNEPGGSLGRLAQRAAAGSAALGFRDDRGYLEPVLEALAIDPSSQVLVFSRTSRQTRHVRPGTPRAIYFNDESYVAWVPDAPALEIASFDPALGPVFYIVPQERGGEARMQRQLGACLRCHDTYGLAGDGVPRFLLGSGYTGSEGELVSHEAWILTSQATPLRSRWGGWYVTGRHGDQVHLGNIVVERVEDLQDLESLRAGNVDELGELIDTSRYLTPYSDIVALMVLEHQLEVQNLISRLRFEAASADGEPLEPHVDALARAMLMTNAAALTGPVSGGSGFGEQFESRGPFDSQGRSLRALDLETRLFEYPLSYLIYSAAFQALPPRAKSAVYARLREVLEGDPAQDGLEALSVADRTAIRGILRDTLPAALTSGA